MGTLLDDTTSWTEFGQRHLDRRISKALTSTLGQERPTLVQSRGIPVALEGRDLLCRARTGSGKTLCYGVPMVQRLLVDTEANKCVSSLRGLVLVPSKELIVQVHEVMSSLLSFAFDVLSVEFLLSGQKYMKTELPTMLVTTPSSLLALLKERKGTMQPLAETLKVLVVDEADLMFSFGYEDDMKDICAYMPATYQAMLFSATLSDEVEKLKGLMLHKPAILKLEEPRVTGKLSQFYFRCHNDDKFLVLYSLLKLQLVQGKILMFVRTVENAYKLRIFLEHMSVNSMVLNAEMPHASRQNVIQSFNQNLCELLIATDEGFRGRFEEDETAGPCDVDMGDNLEALQAPKKRKRNRAERVAAAKEAEAEAEDAEQEDTSAPKKKKRLKKKKGQAEADESVVEAAPTKVVQETKGQLGVRKRPDRDNQFSLTRGVDLKGVTTVINTDMPASVRDYVHRVGRCARGGASGTALTLCTDDDMDIMGLILRAQTSGDGSCTVKSLPLQLADIERFRYRVEDQSRGLTRRAIAKYRAKELQAEALKSERLQAYFEEHPDEKEALQRSQRELKERKSVRKHLKVVPSYLVPESFLSTTPVQEAVRAAKAASGMSESTAQRRTVRKSLGDPLNGVEGRRKSRQQLLRDRMIKKDKRLDPLQTSPEELPPLSGKKMWKIAHHKKVGTGKDALGNPIQNRTPAQKKRRRKFATDQRWASY
mmetsp:Transcript_46515/g.108436  ORF Transcript_46515/g.108436 Transcript_46515/m.108436 type:complete len:709 (-) Transcript_46515:47-2173(-)